MELWKLMDSKNPERAVNFLNEAWTHMVEGKKKRVQKNSEVLGDFLMDLSNRHVGEPEIRDFLITFDHASKLYVFKGAK